MTARIIENVSTWLVDSSMVTIAGNTMPPRDPNDDDDDEEEETKTPNQTTTSSRRSSENPTNSPHAPRLAGPEAQKARGRGAGVAGLDGGTAFPLRHAASGRRAAALGRSQIPEGSAQGLQDALTATTKSGQIAALAADAATAQSSWWVPTSPFITKDDFER